MPAPIEMQAAVMIRVVFCVECFTAYGDLVEGWVSVRRHR